MIGTRVMDWTGSPMLKPGEYATIGGVWYGCTPDGQFVGLAKHTVTEHDDGTITVAPSILVSSTHRPSWHGWLERGVWREA